MNRFERLLLTALVLLGIFTTFVIVGVLSQPVYGSESEKPALSSGYIKPVRSQIAPKRVSITRGYAVSPETGRSQPIRLRTYTTGKRTVTTGRIGNRSVRMETKTKKD